MSFVAEEDEVESNRMAICFGLLSLAWAANANDLCFAILAACIMVGDGKHRELVVCRRSRVM